MHTLKNKVAIVTGSSKGIGAAIAKLFAAEGAKVVVNYISGKDDADKVVKTITDNAGIARAIQCDVSKETDVLRLFEETINTYGTLDILVNNAGIYQYGYIADFSEDAFHQQFNINVLGALLTIRSAVNFFAEKGGSIINISSMASKAPAPAGSVFSASKAALDAITISLSKEFSGRNIRINSILPGLINTEGARAIGIIGSENEIQLLANTPLGRTGLPEDIAKAAVFLASDQASWITGEKLSVSGGVFRL